MATSLVIVESPAKCKKIESYLGPSYKCLASFGHIRELNTKRGLSCIDTAGDFTPTFIESPGKKANIYKIRTALQNCSEVILATDDDREGEAIAWHICKVFDLPIDMTKRIIFHEVTKPALQQAIASPTRIDMDKVNAQLARQVLDLIVGYTVTPILWQQVSKFKKGSLSAGRCQTPALRIVYDNQKDIDAHPGKTGYDITGFFTEHDLPFKLNTHIDTEDDVGEFLDESVSHTHVMKRFKPINVKKCAPIPLTTSAIQQKASNLLRYSPKMTMRSCQILYESGFITYMRTDSKNYSKEFLEKTETFVAGKYGDEYVKQDLFKLSLKTDDVTSAQKTSKSKKQSNTRKSSKKAQAQDAHTQDAHEAIRPTDITRTSISSTGKITPKEVRLYNLIWTHALESCMSDATYKTMKIQISAPQTHQYRYSCEQVVFPGWKIVAGYEKTNPEFDFIQHIKTKKPISYNKIKACFSLFELKTHYSEAKLVSLLEKKGIGRPSTFASLIAKIQERDYVQKQDVTGKSLGCTDFELIGDTIEEIEHTKTVGGEKGKMVITPTGLIVIEFLLQHFDSLFCYDYTKKMENVLDIIAKGEKVWHTLCKSCHTELTGLCSNIKQDCSGRFDIDDIHTYMIGKYGPVIKMTQDGKTTFRAVKKDVSLDDLKAGLLSVEDVMEERKTTQNIIGTHKEKDVVVRSGKFGLYAQWAGKNYSLKGTEKDLSDITIRDVIPYLEGTKHANPNILRILTPSVSLRKGKFGQYIFYKNASMSKPRFLKLQGFSDVSTTPPDRCEPVTILNWLSETYSINTN